MLVIERRAARREASTPAGEKPKYSIGKYSIGQRQWLRGESRSQVDTPPALFPFEFMSP